MMQPDIEKYRQYIDKFDLSESEKIELIQTLWKIMESFVDRAFDVDSTSVAISARNSRHALQSPSMLELKANHIEHKKITPDFENNA
jgi:uncharacterized protein (UPF0335 family)